METPVPAFGEEIRKEFMLKEGGVYLNHGSYGAVPRCVHERQIEYIAELESFPDIWFRKTVYKYIDAAVKKVSKFIGSDPKDTFLLQNTTKGINTILKSYPIQPGQSYMITYLTYPAYKKATHHTATRREGTAVKYLEIRFPIKSEDEVVDLYENFLEQNPDVKLAIIDHIASPTAVLLPVKRLTEVCHRHDVIVVIDGAHAPGLVDIKLDDIDADFYCGNMHKWVFCPRACAFLWRNPRRHNPWLTPLVTSKYDGQGLSREFTYEGNKDDSPFISAMHGIDYYNRLGGREKILDYTTKLQEEGLAYLEKRWGTKRLSIPDSLVSPNQQMVALPYIPYYSEHPDQHDALFLELVERFSVMVTPRDVHGVLMCRIMTQVYNTMDDFRKLADAVLTISREKE